MNRARETCWMSALLLLGCGGAGVVEAPVARGIESTPAALETRGVSPPDIVCDRVVDDFSEDPVGSFPHHWETRFEGNRAIAEREGAFEVSEFEGRRGLRVRTASIELTLGRGIEQWDLAEYPWISWEWRVTRFESTDDEEGPEPTVKAVWLIGLPFMVRQIDYTWSGSLPVGTRTSGRLGHDQRVVLDSGREELGVWKQVRVDLRKHHRSFFELSEDETPTGIALTVNGSTDDGAVEFHFANLRLCRPHPRTPQQADHPENP